MRALAVEARFRRQPAFRVIREPVAFALGVDQFRQLQCGIVAVLHRLADGVRALHGQALAVVAVARLLAGAIHVRDQIAVCIVGVVFPCFVWCDEPGQAAEAIVLVAADVAHGIACSRQSSLLVVAVFAAVAGTVRVAGKQALAVVLEMLAAAPGVDQFHQLAALVVAVARDVAQGIRDADGTACRIVFAACGVAQRIGEGDRLVLAIVCDAAAVPFGIGAAGQVAGCIVGVADSGAVGVDIGQQHAIAVPLAPAQRGGLAVDDAAHFGDQPVGVECVFEDAAVFRDAAGVVVHVIDARMLAAIVRPRDDGARLVAISQVDGMALRQFRFAQWGTAPAGAQRVQADPFQLVTKTRVAAARREQVVTIAVAARVAQGIRLVDQVVAGREGRLGIVRFAGIVVADMAESAAVG